MVHTWQLLDEMVRLLHVAILIVCYVISTYFFFFAKKLNRILDLFYSMHPGYLRVFDYTKEHLVCGGKSYYGGLLCCAWR